MLTNAIASYITQSSNLRREIRRNLSTRISPEIFPIIENGYKKNKLKEIKREISRWRMGKKRKSLATSLDEVDRTMYSTFCSAANSLSQLYTQAMNQQKLSFLSGERHGMVFLLPFLFGFLVICYKYCFCLFCSFMLNFGI